MTGPANPKRRLVRGPESIVLIVAIALALVIAGLIGTEFYARHHAATVVNDAVQCEVEDTAKVSFSSAPPVLWQYLTDHYTKISAHTAGNQVRDAKGMTVDLTVQDIRLDATADSKGTIGAIDGTVTWSSDGIKETVQDALPGVGNILTSDVSTDPGAGTVELKGLLNNLTVKPELVDGGLSLKVIDLSLMGHDMSKDETQKALDEVTSKATKNYPLGIHGDSVQVTDSGVTAHFSSSNATIPHSGGNHPCLDKL